MTTDNKQRKQTDEKASADEPSQSAPVLKPKFGNPNSFRNQGADRKGNQTFNRQPRNVVRHKG